MESNASLIQSWHFWLLQAVILIKVLTQNSFKKPFIKRKQQASHKIYDKEVNQEQVKAEKFLTKVAFKLKILEGPQSSFP